MPEETDLLCVVLAPQMNFLRLINLMAFSQTDHPDPGRGFRPGMLAASQSGWKFMIGLERDCHRSFAFKPPQGISWQPPHGWATARETAEPGRFAG
jgi:hypothetical protein